MAGRRLVPIEKQSNFHFLSESSGAIISLDKPTEMEDLEESC